MGLAAGGAFSTTGGALAINAGGRATGGGVGVWLSGAGGSNAGASGESGECVTSAQCLTSDCKASTECRKGCGNGRVEPPLGETCDDGNNRAGDGCSADCKTLETNFACPEPGKPCTNLVVCGDGKLAGPETCDDGNTMGGDGCSADCGLERGYDCVAPGSACIPHCGDGLLRGDEECEAPNVAKGCSANCRLEPGFVCEPLAAPGPAQCHATRCGDSIREGIEACDDGNSVDGDGCSSACSLEPDCRHGTCSSRCGDYVKISPEECDDGNTTDGDGCDHACHTEPGFTCSDSTTNPPEALNLLVTYRDFVSFPLSTVARHPDFESAFAADERTPGLVQPELDVDGKPKLDGRCSDEQLATTADRILCPYGQMLTTGANFELWYRDSPGINLSVMGALRLARLTNNAYVFDSAPQGFYPLDGQGLLAPPAREATAIADPVVNDGKEHNFGFTTEIRYFFQYRGAESLSFSGDDDLWIFINRHLALDLGGLHPRRELTLTLDSVAQNLGISPGSLYEIALFHAERHSAASNFKLTLTGFTPTRSRCAATCGDGVVVLPEQCDQGRSLNTGSYGGCSVDCKRGPYCGDGMAQPGKEDCDDGVNLSTYSTSGTPRCAPGCVLSDYCGDGKLDGLFGEQCDLGRTNNTGEYNGCSGDCQLGPRCGDGILQSEFGETCDDGNSVSGDGCGYDCKPDVR